MPYGPRLTSGAVTGLRRQLRAELESALRELQTAAGPDDRERACARLAKATKEFNNLILFGITPEHSAPLLKASLLFPK